MPEVKLMDATRCSSDMEEVGFNKKIRQNMESEEETFNWGNKLWNNYVYSWLCYIFIQYALFVAI